MDAVLYALSCVIMIALACLLPGKTFMIDSGATK